MTTYGLIATVKPLSFRCTSKIAKRVAYYHVIHTKKTIGVEQYIELDSFTAEFLSNYTAKTPLQSGILKLGSAIMSLVDPHRHDMIACLGETTGANALSKVLNKMKLYPEGCAILKDRPRVNTKTINLNYLKSLPEDTFGHVYLKFLEDNNVTPDTRLGVKFLDDIELGYVMQRYRETHDLYHALLGMPTHMLGEVSVKWIEALNNELPMCIGGALFGALRLRPKQRQLFKKYYLPWAIQVGQRMPLLMPIYWEKRWEQPICDLRKELRVELLHVPK